MATLYFDPVGGNDTSGTGAIGTPYKTLSKLSTVAVNGDTCLIKCDTEWTTTSRALLTGKTGIIIGNYGSGALPKVSCVKTFVSTEWDGVTPADPTSVLNKWYEVSPEDGFTGQAGSHLWRLNLATYADTPRYVCFGVLGNYGTHLQWWYSTETTGEVLRADLQPVGDKQYAIRKGASAADPAAIIVWAPENPVSYYGAIHYQTSQNPALRFNDCAGIEVYSLESIHGHGLVHFNNVGASGSGHKAIDLRGSYLHNIATVYGGAKASAFWLENFRIAFCRGENMLGDSIIGMDNIRDGIIENNVIDASGLVYSSGAIYFGNCYAGVGHEVHIRKNHINDQKFARYWQHDGRGVMTDSDSSNVWIYQNLVTNSHQAYGSNAGSAGNRFFSNVALDCDMGYVESDTSGLDATDTYICNNSFIGCGINALFERGDESKVAKSVIWIDGTSGQTIKNNLITASSNGAAWAGIGMPSAVSADEDHNLIYGFARGIQAGASDYEIALGANSITENPRLDGTKLLPSSPCIGAGADWWTSLSMSPVDYHGSRLGADMGAVNHGSEGGVAL